MRLSKGSAYERVKREGREQMKKRYTITALREWERDRV
jgi:hypothetical protein